MSESDSSEAKTEPAKPAAVAKQSTAKIPIMTGITTDGGYAEVMIAEARALALIPDELKSEEAAPLVCAGITTFNALRNSGRAGDTVAIQGIGGLGHLGVQFARKMGFRTVAIGGGPDKEHLAKKLGAHVYIDAKAEDAAAALQKLGGADVILATAPSGSAIGGLLPGLAVRGKLVVVGVSDDAIPLNGVPLIFGGRSVRWQSHRKSDRDPRHSRFQRARRRSPHDRNAPTGKSRRGLQANDGGQSTFPHGSYDDLENGDLQKLRSVPATSLISQSADQLLQARFPIPDAR